MSNVPQPQQQQPEATPQLELPIDWHFPEGLQSKHVTNILVQIGELEVYISFFEARPPVLIGQPEENQAKLKSMGAIRAECVSSIVVDPERLQSFITALQTSLDNYRTLKESQQKGE